jgi:hypothetical protein
MLADILYFLKAALFVIGLVFLLMIPFFGYLYWLNNKQNRYFKKLGKELNLDYRSLGTKIRRDFPELNGFLKGVQVFIGARRTKGRYGSSAVTRNHYPIVLIEFAIQEKLESFKLDVTGKEIKYWCTPMQTMNANTLTQLQYHAKEHGNFSVSQSKEGVLQVSLKDELSNEKRYQHVKALIPLLVELALDINSSTAA